MIIAVHKWGMIVSDQDEDGELSDDETVKDDADAENFSMDYWREGIMVMYESGSFLIQSFKDTVRLLLV